MNSLYIEQQLPINIDQAWDFFSNPNNLNAITPPQLSFKILSKLPQKMYEGMLIAYKIKPFLNIPMNWLTEITTVAHQQYFIDEQRSGPYKLWHHEHHFEANENGVLMKDLLHYDIGMGPLGSIAGKLYVHKTIQNIFDYRCKTLQEIFPASK